MRPSRLTPLFDALEDFAGRISRVSQSLLPPEPQRRWKPWSPSRVLSIAIAFGAVVAILAILAPKVAHVAKNGYYALTGKPALADDDPIVTPAVIVAGSADAKLQRDGRSPCAGGVLVVLPDFQSDDGAFDLVVHFHGNTDLTIESFGAAKINAVLVVMNLGTGSGAYENHFSNAIAFPDLLDRAAGAMKKRGLRDAKVRRVALSAWSAGYGAVVRTIQQPALAERVDSVILLDGIHVGFAPDGVTLDPGRLEPFTKFAEQAATGKKLMTITHSDIVPGDYAGTRATTDAVLRAVGVERTPGGPKPPWPDLPSMVGVVPKAKLRPLDPESFARQNGLIVRGYKGETPEDHISHLMQMSVTALPDLAARWASPAAQ